MDTNTLKKNLLKLEVENDKWVSDVVFSRRNNEIRKLKEQLNANYVLVLTAKDYKLEKYYYSLHDFNIQDVVNALPIRIKLFECSLSFKEIK